MAYQFKGADRADIVRTKTETHYAILKLLDMDRRFIADMEALRGNLPEAPTEEGVRCGTNAGYAMHIRKGEPPCLACYEAHRLYQAEYRERVKAA